MKLLLIGKRRYDLDFVSDYLERYHDFKKMRISDGVDKIARYFYMYGKGKRLPWERKLEMYDLLYKVDKDIHLNLLKKKLSLTTREHIVIDDVRYVNELQALREAGFLVVRISSSSQHKRTIRNLKNASEGTIILREHFGTNLTKINADYALWMDNRVQGREAIEQLLDSIRTDVL